MLRVIVAALLAAVVLFAWGFVFWTVLPISKTMFQPAESEASLTDVLSHSLPHSGVYVLPHCDCSSASSEAQAAFLDRHRAGPIVQIYYHKEGLEPMSPLVFVQGFAQMFVSSILAGLLLLLALPNLSSYFARVLFVTLLGVFAVVALHLANPIWFHHPWRFTLLQSGFDSVGWLLASLVMGLVIRPRE